MTLIDKDKYIGQKFGRLTVIDIKKENDKYICQCECECGNIKEIKLDNLRYNHTKSCGCLQRERASESGRKDLSGLKFGRLTVIKRVEPYISPQGARLSKYLCKCDCDNEVEILGSHLVTGFTTSCGCYKMERTSESHSSDLIGQRFGLLTVVDKIGSETHNGQKRIVWDCLCDCGNYVQLNTNVLTSGNTTSCGCRRWFKGEEKIKEYLENQKIQYERQKMFDDLIGDKGWKLRYDFYIPKANLLIEYQGRQHYEKVNFCSDYQKAQEAYESQLQNDKTKRDYAATHNIELLEIPYTEYDNIDEILYKNLE